nr:hypothetical protein [Tanacetum cinerariifolium]
CYLRNVVIEIAVLNILSDALPITTNGIQLTMSNPQERVDSPDSPLLRVNTPRCDEDRLKLMELMVFLLQKDVCVEIGITAARLSSYCCQANNTASVKRSGDVTRLQALVDKKKIVISKAVIRKILQLNDAEGVVCLPNEEIFAGLAQMGYEKPSTKLTFYKAFFSSQWNLVRNVDSSSKSYMYPRFIQLIIQNQVGDLSTHSTRFISPALTQKVFANMIRVEKGISWVKTPLFEEMFVAVQPAEKGLVAAQVDVAVDAVVKAHVAEDVVYDAISSPLPHVIPSPSQEPSSPPQQQQSSPQAPPQDAEFPTQLNKMIADMDMNEGIELVKDAEVAESEGRNAAEHAEKQAEIYNLDLDHSSKVLIRVASTTIPAAKPSIPAAAPTVVAAYTRRRNGVIIRYPEEELPLKTPAETPKVKDKGKGILVEAPKPLKKKDQIEMDAEYARKLQEEIDRGHDGFNKDTDWDAAMDHVNQKSSSNPQYIKRYQGMKKRPQTESEARKNMMIYLKNTDGYKMGFFKGMKYAQICPIFQARFDENIRFLFKSREEMEAGDQEIIKSINETPTQKTAKRRKLSEEAEDLKKRLEVVEDEDDDVFVEATPLASKVPVVDYQIVLIDNKPRFKIIRADETHQFYISFVTLLNNFDREDLETLWRIVKDRFSTSKPTNFLDEYLLLTLKTMFEEPDGQDAIWRNQKSVHGLALVKRWKLLTSCGVHVITLSTV